MQLNIPFFDPDRRVEDLVASCSGLLALLASVLILASCSERPIPPEGSKNVIVLTLDGLRQDHLSVFG